MSATVASAMSATLASASASALAGHVAAQSILDAPHTSPTVYSSSSPYTIFIIQAVIVITLSRILNVFLARIRQPRVIADIIAGILLGPTAFGRIPNFSNTIFPSASIPGFSLIANMGLIFFLFLVGLEVDLSVFKKNTRGAIAISFFGLAVPFAVGWGVGYGVFHEFVDSSVVAFNHFGLFIAVAFGITAFPVLARILTDLNLLSDDVGVTVLSAGVVNDVVGWVLLALSVALVNAGSGVTTVYVILAAAGWSLVLFLVIKPILHKLISYSNGYNNGPSQGMMVVIILLVMISAEITNIIGVHPIFGGFMVGMIVPHRDGFARGVFEKMEDFVAAFFLPLYFALSGLSTDLGLLNNGSIWGWVFVVIFGAFLSKFIPSALAGRYFGSFTWRESLATGSLMSCKGLVELVVLNIGLNAGILNQSVFAMFVLMALVTTFATTPLVLWFYPATYRQMRVLERRAAKQPSSAMPSSLGDKPDEHARRRFAFVFSQMEHLPSAMAFIKLIQTPVDYATANSTRRGSLTESSDLSEKGDTSIDEKPDPSSPRTSLKAPSSNVDALRLIELSERYSSVIHASEGLEEAARKDPLLNIFRTFTALNGFAIEPELKIVGEDSYADTVVDFAIERGSDLLVVPWSAASAPAVPEMPTSPSSGPLDGLFGRASNALERSPQYAAFVRRVFQDSPCDVALFLDRGFGAPYPAAMPSGRQHIFVPFVGGPDDRAALALVMQLAQHPGVTATVIRVQRSAEPTDEDRAQLSQLPSKATAATDATAVAETSTSPAMPHLTIHGGVMSPDTLYPGADPTNALQSETADNLAIARYFPAPANADARLRGALARSTFVDVQTVGPLRATIARAQAAAGKSQPLLVIAGRGRRGGTSNRDELQTVLNERVAGAADRSGALGALGIVASSQVRATLGDVGSAIVASGVAGSLLVIQANTKPTSASKKEV